MDFTAQLSGPIIKDKLFFFASAQRYQRDQDPIGPAHGHNEASDRFNGKLTWQPGANDNVTAHLQFDNYNITGRAGSTASPTPTTSRTARTRRSTCGSRQWRHLFGSKTFTEVKYTGWWGFYDLNPEHPGPPYHIDENRPAARAPRATSTTPTAAATRSTRPSRTTRTASATTT